MAGVKRRTEDVAVEPAKKHKPDHSKTNSSTKQQRGNGKLVSKSAAGGKKWDRSKDGRDGGKESFIHAGQSSREAHAAQRELALQRKLAKPHGDVVARSKKIWERLRIKSAVPKDERAALVSELFEIITGRVKDFVFKHDSVRVIQCALKYASKAQKRQIVEELRGSYRELAESRYGKFLVAKLVVTGDEARDVIVGEFVGGVKRAVRHPEAGWILDDIYRGAATPAQKARLLREWYGPEFVVFRGSESIQEADADLGKILEMNPEKRAPIMGHLKEMINLLVQKKTTGFTMLHDAMLQYFLNCQVGGPEQTEFLEMLKDDEEGDCVRNLAFTKSGSRLVCLALAYGSAKDRRNILKFFKTHIRLMAGDVNACRVLLTAYEVIDDTVMTAKTFLPELLGKEMEKEPREEELMSMVTHVTPRMALLYPMVPEVQKWLMIEADIKILKEVKAIREDTSKKQPETRRKELVQAMSQPLLDLIDSQVATLAQSSFGCQFMAEVLVGGIGDKAKALEAILNFVDEDSSIVDTPAFGRMLKTLVQGGRFDTSTKTIIPVDPPLRFHNMLYERITALDEEAIMPWACRKNPFVVLSMLEANDFSHTTKLKKILRDHTDALKIDNAGAQKILENIGAEGQKRKVKIEVEEPVNGEADQRSMKTKGKKVKP